MNTVFAISCYPPIWTIERHGRRPMMFWTALGCAICLIVFIAVTNLDHQTKALGWVAAASVIIYNIIFGYGWLGPPWVYGPEVSFLHSPMYTAFDLTKARNQPDRTSSATSHCWRPWSSWRVAINLHHGFRRWNRN